MTSHGEVEDELGETSSIVRDRRRCGGCNCCWPRVSSSVRAVALSKVVSVGKKSEDIDVITIVGAVVWSQARFRSAEIVRERGEDGEVLDVVEDDEIVAKACLAVGDACRVGKF